MLLSLTFVERKPPYLDGIVRRPFLQRWWYLYVKPEKMSRYALDGRVVCMYASRRGNPKLSEGRDEGGYNKAFCVRWAVLSFFYKISTHAFFSFLLVMYGIRYYYHIIP